MFKRRVIWAALILAGCDGGGEGEHGGAGHHANGIEVLMGRAPRAQPHAESHVAAAPEGANSVASPAEAEPSPTPEPAAEAPPPEGAEAPPTEGDAAPTEADAVAPTEAAPAEPEAAPPEAPAEPATPPPAGTDFTKIAKVRLSNPKIDDGIDAEVVRKRVRTGIGDLRKCYVAGLERNAALSGRVELEFVIDKKGKISSSTVRSTDLSDASVADCMAKAVEAWRFEPAPAGDVKVRFPFSLGTD